MKTFITSLFLLASVVAFAQTKDFAIDLSESSVSIKPGESKQVTVSIVRSKYFAKEKATLGLQSALPQGVTLTYEPKEGNFENSNALISVAPDATPGTYNIVLSATLNTKRKGSILKVTVGSDQVAAK
ncbi:MAG: putative Ig domain-containing protein [Bacteroidetes bacterium]|nr:putative Ig domain-containing protein [Bacteroidota bacterium]